VNSIVRLALFLGIVLSASRAAAQSCQLDVDGEDPLGFYRTDVWQKGEVVLTFDDGPHIAKTPKVLDALAKHGMHATFFLVGRAINSRTYHLVQRELADGHTLGTHSYGHDVQMASRQKSVEYIRGEHETTRTLIDLALVAESPADFDKLFRRVFQKKPFSVLSEQAIRKEWPRFAERMTEVLRERGKVSHPLVYSRPPGGGPFLGNAKRERERYGQALQGLGMLNVMWHSASGDTDDTHRHDVSFLTNNVRYGSQRGGILLLHDGIRSDALGSALSAMKKDSGVRVISLDTAVARKFGCSPSAIRQSFST
jgi:peptidoglycan/xylan/chitin deacetylase (PgdA/CDA1 family)